MNDSKRENDGSSRETLTEVVTKVKNPISILLISLMIASPIVLILGFSPELAFGFIFIFILFSLIILLSIFVIYQGHRQKAKLKLHFLFIINGFYSLLLGILVIISFMGDPANYEDYSYELEMQLFTIAELFFIFSLTYSFLTLIASLFFIFTSKDHSLLFYSTMFITTFHGISVITIFIAYSITRGFDLLCSVFYFTPIVFDILIAMSIVSYRNRKLKRYQSDGVQ